MIIAAIIVTLVALSLLWSYRRRRGSEPGFGFVYVNQDGTVRELSPAEREYVSAEYSGGDSGRPYIKSRFESVDGWGSQSGFILRRRVPTAISILPVHPAFDERETALVSDFFASFRAAGDLIETRSDGSVVCTPNPLLSKKKRFELSRIYHLEEQRRREALAKSDGD